MRTDYIPESTKKKKLSKQAIYKISTLHQFMGDHLGLIWQVVAVDTLV